jgi:hypothetical protein
VILGLFMVAAKEKCFSEKDTSLVLAPSYDSAVSCMTSGSDSLWVSVESCVPIGSLDIQDESTLKNRWYENSGGYVIG